jgi:hypothetical protein
MADGDKAEEQESPDRFLVRPYIQIPESGPPLPEASSGEESSAEARSPGEADGTAELPAVEVPCPAEPAEKVAPPAPDVSQDGRQMAWLIGAGLALIVATVVTIVTLWPGSDENPSAAAPPGESAWPAPAASAPPAPSSATPSTSVRSSPSRSASSSPTPAPSSARPSPPPSLPPSATLAPPPAADRVGPIIGPGGNCLDVSAGIVLPGSAVAVRGCNGTLSQRWTVATDGTLRVGGSCAEAGGSGQVTVGLCGDAASAQWRSGAGGTMVNMGSGQCLTASADNRVRVAGCGAGGQAWTLP